MAEKEGLERKSVSELMQRHTLKALKDRPRMINGIE